jgi:hypothetical protein
VASRKPHLENTKAVDPDDLDLDRKNPRFGGDDVPAGRKGEIAIMIPFCIDGGPDDDDDLPQEVLAGQWRRLIAQFGELFYRYTMPIYAAVGLRLHHEQGIHVDMVDWASRLQDFVSGVITKLQLATAP